MSCINGGYTECCTKDDCRVFAPKSSLFCFCDSLCFSFNDCCDDISLINCTPKSNGKLNSFKIKCNDSNSSLHTATLGSVLPYISLNNSNGVVTEQLVPDEDERCSPQIELPNMFPLGNKSHFKVTVCTCIF